MPGTLARTHDRIINLASAAGLQSLPTTSASCVGKTAVIHLTERLALETGAQGVCVFAVHPGTVRTPLNDYVPDADEIKHRAPLVQ